MREFHLKPLVARNRRIRKGDRVRIVGIPDLSNMHPGRRAESEHVSCTFAERASASMDSIDTGLSKSSSRSVVARFLGGITSLSNQIYCWFNVRRMEPNPALEPIT